MLSGGLDARGLAAPPADAPVVPAVVRDAPDPAPEVMSEAPGAPDQPLADWAAVVGLGVLGAAVALWLRSLSTADPADLSELGLVSVMPAIYFVAVAMLTVGFVLLATDRTPRRLLTAAYLVAFAAVAHATAPLLSGTPGNPWAWANVAVVDAVQRTGELPAGTGLGAPTEWPGFYAFSALVADASGLDPSAVAMWTPLVFNLLALLALWVLFRSITDDERVVWSALWLFVLGNWVGQDHLSAIGFSLVLALALYAVALPLDRHGGPGAVISGNVGPAERDTGSLAAIVVLVLLLAAALVVSHQVTALLVAATFAVAAATRTSRTAWLAVVIGVAGLGWIAGPARTFLDGDPLRLAEPLGSPAQFALTTTQGLADLTTGAQTVLIAGRFVAQGIVVLALVGLVVRYVNRRPIAYLVGAICVPVVLVVADRSSESVLRAYLFALGWLALAGAFALVALRRGPRRGVVLQVLVVGVLTAGFVVVQSGERDDGYFTAEEVDLARALSASAPAATLLIEGTTNAPGVTGNLERFTRTPVSDGSADEVARIAADPAGELHARSVAAEAAGFEAVFVVIGRSQERGEALAPRLPPGLLASIERDLRTSDRFVVVAETADAVAFAPVGGGS